MNRIQRHHRSGFNTHDFAIDAVGVERLLELLRLLSDEGFQVEHLEYVGMPLGYVLEALRHMLAARMNRAGASPETRSGASGRWLQPPEGLGFATRYVTSPFRKLERLLPKGRGGTTLIVLARVANHWMAAG